MVCEQCVYNFVDTVSYVRRFSRHRLWIKCNGLGVKNSVQTATKLKISNFYVFNSFTTLKVNYNIDIKNQFILIFQNYGDHHNVV